MGAASPVAPLGQDAVNYGLRGMAVAAMLEKTVVLDADPIVAPRVRPVPSNESQVESR